MTNGVTPRRFIKLANPWLSDLITDTIGAGWVTDLDRLAELEPYAEDEDFRRAFRKAKEQNKTRLYTLLRTRDGIDLPDGHLLDVMVKRLHEYKRQTLKLLHVVTLYDQIISGRVDPKTILPRTVVFGAKAAPGYRMAKDTISLINAVAATINADKRVGRTAQRRLPRELQRDAGREADPGRRPVRADLARRHGGVRHRQHEVRPERRADHRHRRRRERRDPAARRRRQLLPVRHARAGGRRAAGRRLPARPSYYEENADLKGAIDLIASGAFSDGDRNTFEPVVSNLLYQDRFMALADYQLLPRGAGQGGEGLRQQGGLDEVGDPQRRPLRLLLLRRCATTWPIWGASPTTEPGASGDGPFAPTAPAKGAVTGTVPFSATVVRAGGRRPGGRRPGVGCRGRCCW